MLDLTREWRWWVGGTEVTAAVDTWELAREQPDLDTPAYWRGKVVLVRPVGSTLVLDPLSNPQWRQGSEARLELDGSLVFTGQVLLAYYNDWVEVPRLELEVGDLLAVNNRRRVIPLAQHSPQSLLGLPGAPTSPTVEITTDLDSPVRIAQQLTWVGDPPTTLYTRSDGTVSVARPETSPTFSRQVTDVLDATRVRPALEIPGSVVASASMRFSLAEAESVTTTERVLFELDERQRTVTVLDGLGRPVRREIQTQQGLTISQTLWTYSIDSPGVYTVGTYTWALVGGQMRFWERESERIEILSSSTFVALGWPAAGSVQSEALRTKRVYWPLWRLGVRISGDEQLVYQETEFFFKLPGSGEGHVFRSVARARGTLEEGLPIDEAVRLVTVSSEIKPGNYVPPAWARPAQQGARVVPVSATAEVVGGDGPPLHVSLPWLTDPTTAQSTLEKHARWVATEVAGRVYARRMVMPVPSEWLSDPRPWRMLRFELTPPEAMWLVGERLSADRTGVRFEALGVLASPPGQIPEGAGIPSLLSFVQRGRPSIGIGVMGGPVEILALETSVGSGAEGSVNVTENTLAVGIGADADPGAVAVGHGVEGTTSITGGGGGGGGEGNYLVLQAEDADSNDGDIISDNEASGCQAVTLDPSKGLSWGGFTYSSSSTVWLRIRYRDGGGTVDLYYGYSGEYVVTLSVPPSPDYTAFDIPLESTTITYCGLYIIDGGPFTIDAVMLVDQDTLDSTGWPDFPPCTS